MQLVFQVAPAILVAVIKELALILLDDLALGYQLPVERRRQLRDEEDFVQLIEDERARVANLADATW